MSNLATKIQTWVQIWSDYESLVLTSGNGLEILNEVYAGMFNPDYKILGAPIGRRWPENFAQDTSISTVASQEAYNWPTSPVFHEEPSIKIQGTSGGTVYHLLAPAKSEEEWRLAVEVGDSFPSIYRRKLVAGTMKLLIRPTPVSASLTIEISGYTEITEFTTTTAIDGTTDTIFFNQMSDRALAKFIAAVYKDKRGDPQRAQALVREGIGLLPSTQYMPELETNEITPVYL